MIRKLTRFTKALLIAAGVAAVGLFTLCFTPAPWRLVHWLGTDPAKLGRTPDCIVILGGGGIPSESGLMRTYEGSVAAAKFPDAKIIVALPSDGDPQSDHAAKMRNELVLRGVSPERILAEPAGRNTREQALNVAKMIDPKSNAVLVVTSPYHMKRALKSFRKAGFKNSAGEAAFDSSVVSDLLYKAGSMGGNRLPIPDVGGKLMLRYTFWSNLRYLADGGRELSALAYYKLRGWI